MGNEPLDGTKLPETSPASDPCPRCGAETKGRDACARCGLHREHRERFAADTALPPGLAEKWDAVLAAWDDAAAHAIFLESCVQAEALDLAAARYRALRADPARAERCGRSLDRIVALAEAGLKKTSSGAEKVVRNRRIIFAVAVLVMLAFLSLVAWAVLSR
ncbi:MAG: hypothetical protein HY905_10170 [Deltaproteobacteria bacterium]|nr:hypothetical protein [Deltaproteobacteria bacterium]